MTPSTKTTALSFLAIVALTGCVGTMSYPTIEPVSFKPSGMSPSDAVPVDSLTPTFVWKQRPEDVMARMDFAIWYVGTDGAPGELVYSKRGFVGNLHAIEEPLTPGVEYFWSVKRSDSMVWAKANYAGASPIGVAWQSGVPFKIKTPASSSAPAPIAPHSVVAQVPLHTIPASNSSSQPQEVRAAPESPAIEPNAALTVKYSSSQAAYAAWEPWIGGTWRGDLPPDNEDGAPRHMERTYSWCDNKEGDRIEGWDFKGEMKTDHVTGLILWNQSEGRFHVEGTSSSGVVTQNVLHQEGDMWVSEINQTTKDGKVYRGRGEMKLIEADAGSYLLFMQRGGQWLKVLDMRMERRGQTGGITP